MSSNLAFQWNIGHAGAAWITKICNMHENLIGWSEISLKLHIKYVRSYEFDPNTDFNIAIGRNNPEKEEYEPIIGSQARYELIYNFIKFQYRQRSEKTLLIVKDFDMDLIERCRKELTNQIAMMLLVRHPIVVIDFFAGYDFLSSKTWQNKRRPLKNSFLKHTNWFKQRYEEFINIHKAHNIPIVKLESMNLSLRQKTPYFQNLIENFFKVKFNNQLMKQIETMHDYKEDPITIIWDKWDKTKRVIFIKNFQNIMNYLDYKI